MRYLGEILFKPDLNKDGRAVTRQAVRAIIWSGARLLMIHSPLNGDYKFPGGGIEPGETHQEALLREIREECGRPAARVLEPYGWIVEYDRPKETDYDVFKMTSHYFVCEVDEDEISLSLDDYEERLGFHPVWVDIEEAIRVNRELLASTLRRAPRWTLRDTTVLEMLGDRGNNENGDR